MAKNIITATEVRNNFFNLVDMVAATGNPVYIKKGREVKVRLEPVDDELDEKWDKAKKWLDRTRGMWADKSEGEIRGRFKEADKKATLRIRRRKW